MQNWVADALAEIGTKIYGSAVDGAVTNKGGIRTDLTRGDVSTGQLLNLVPFSNTVTVLEMDGATLQQCLDDVAATGGQCVSQSISFTIRNKKAANARISGKKIEPKKIYHIATIDYVAAGNDRLFSFAKGKDVAHSDQFMKYDIIDLVKALTADGKTIKADHKERMLKK